jgi:universal stress protein A
MSSRGLTGARKLFFGSTTERVLRETTSPVLVTPPEVKQNLHAADARQIVGRILVPVDLTIHSPDHVRIAATIAEAVSVPLILVHVMEPARTRLAARLQRTGIPADRRAVAEDRLKELAAGLPGALHTETLIVYGDPAEELSKVAEDRRVGLVVMGSHASRTPGPRMGSVTYRTLCLLRTAVLAVPPARDSEDEHPGVEGIASIAS